MGLDVDLVLIRQHPLTLNVCNHESETKPAELGELCTSCSLSLSLSQPNLKLLLVMQTAHDCDKHAKVVVVVENHLQAASLDHLVKTITAKLFSEPQRKQLQFNG